MQNVILGGLITLAVTALVQVLIIPWVQRRTRRLERWENDVIELRTLLNEQMAKTMLDFTRIVKSAWAQTPAGGVLEGAAPGTAHSRMPGVEMWNAVSDSFDALIGHQHRLYELRARVALVSRHAPLWVEVTETAHEVEKTIAALDPNPWSPLFDLDEVELDLRIGGLIGTQSYLAFVVNKLSISMRPPRTYPTRRARAWIGRRFRLLRRRQTGGPATERPASAPGLD